MKTVNLKLEDAFRFLSRRESEVLYLVVSGFTIDQIAEHLFLSKSTVKNHITSINKILNLKGKGQLNKWIESISS